MEGGRDEEMEDQMEGKMVVKRREEGRRAGEVGTGKRKT